MPGGLFTGFFICPMRRREMAICLSCTHWTCIDGLGARTRDAMESMRSRATHTLISSIDLEQGSSLQGGCGETRSLPVTLPVYSSTTLLQRQIISMNISHDVTQHLRGHAAVTIFGGEKPLWVARPLQSRSALCGSRRARSQVARPEIRCHP